MRIADRLRRLEQIRDGDDRMSNAEIEAAAAEFERKIAGLGAEPSVADPDEARAMWRAFVTGPNPSWLQRVFANADPEDFYA